MTDETTTTEQPVDEPAEGQGPETETAEQEPDDTQAEDTESTEDNEPDETTLSPEDAVKAVSKLRKENASWRTKFRDLEAKMQEATTAEDIEKVKTEFAAQSRNLLVENVALKYDLPAELAERLSGDTREALEADAKKLVKFVVKETKSADLSGGLDPSVDDGEFDAESFAREMRKRSRTY